MILNKIRSLFKKQVGYTVIEIVASMAVVGLIGLGATMANFQLINQTVTNNDHTTANRHVLNAIQWISRDAQMAQIVQGASGFPTASNLTFSWTTWENEQHEIVYSVDNGQLTRRHSVGGNLTEVTLIAQYVNIDPSSTNCTWDDAGELVLTVTGSVGEGSRTVNVTKEKTISPRPYLH